MDNLHKIFSRVFLVLATTAAAMSAEVASAGDAGKQVGGHGAFATTDKTSIDFSDTMIDGKMQAPAGFFLQGRQAQSLTQMVKLRSRFRGELRNSREAVKALVK